MHTLTQWTVEDYHKMIEAGILTERRVELIAGEIIDMSPEGSIHSFINYRGVIYLRSLLGQQAIIREAHPITLANSEPEPDIAIVSSPDTRYLDHHPYPEDIYWLIEISDRTLKKDSGIKKKVYAGAGIREYWIIDITSQILKVFQNPLEGDYQIQQDYQQGMVSPLAFPSLQVSVERLMGKEVIK
jgi:Uma2 family endonuclease